MQAKKATGQGRVRNYKSGRMTRCVRTTALGRCHRHNRYIALDRDYSDMPDYKCDPCTKGLDPFIPKTGRVGQQKQAKKS